MALHQLQHSAAELRNLGVEIPSWQELSEGKRPPPQSVPDQTPGCFPIRGWQRWGSYLIDESFRTSIWDQFNGTEHAHIRSQGGKGSGIAFTVVPTSNTMETGGRWSEEAWKFVHLLSKARARSDPKLLQKEAAIGWAKRWQGLLAVSAQRAIAESFLKEKRIHGVDGVCVSISEMLAGHVYML